MQFDPLVLTIHSTLSHARFKRPRSSDMKPLHVLLLERAPVQFSGVINQLDSKGTASSNRLSVVTLSSTNRLSNTDQPRADNAHNLVKSSKRLHCINNKPINTEPRIDLAHSMFSLILPLVQTGLSHLWIALQG
jgi:hypothetical protein